MSIIMGIILCTVGASGMAKWIDKGVKYTISTDVAKDGTLAGPNLELLKQVCAATKSPVVASGGVSSLEDLKALRDLVSIGVEGAIVGKALYANNFTLSDAVAVSEGN